MKRFFVVLGVFAAVLCGALGVLLWVTWEPPYPRAPAVYLDSEPAHVPRGPARTGHTLVLLVFDGFARGSFEAAPTPNLDRIVAEGAHTLDMRPAWPSLSLPNHFTLSTGCLPARHGVVSNHFLDPERGFYNMRGDADWLLECELLHEVAERQGVRSAVLRWVGSASGRRGALASVAVPFDAARPSPGEQVDAVIAQLSRPPAERPGYIAAYATEPDASGHQHGPLGEPTLAAVSGVDAAVGKLLGHIEQHGLADSVTLVVTTDHGMVDVHGSVNLPRILRRAGIEGQLVAEAAVGHLYLDDPSTRLEALAALRSVAPAELVEVIDPRNPPEGLSLGQSARVGEIVLLPLPGYFAFDLSYWPAHYRFLGLVGPDALPSRALVGSHGYDPSRVPGVRSLLFAWGARVRPGTRIETLRAEDLHPTLAHLMNIEPGSPVDGVARTAFLAPPPPAAPDAGVAAPPAAGTR